MKSLATQILSVRNVRNGSRVDINRTFSMLSLCSQQGIDYPEKSTMSNNNEKRSSSLLLVLVLYVAEILLYVEIHRYFMDSNSFPRFKWIYIDSNAN